MEFVDDAYEEILKAEKNGLIKIIRYDEMTDKKKEWLKNIIKEEYKNAIDHPEYRFFLEGIFHQSYYDIKIRLKTDKIFHIK
mgnify:CR=1 FL=1